MMRRFDGGAGAVDILDAEKLVKPKSPFLPIAFLLKNPMPGLPALYVLSVPWLI